MATREATFCVGGFVVSMRRNEPRSFVRHLRAVFTSDDCRLINSVRGCFRGTLCLIFVVVNFCARIRHHASGKHVSTIIHATSCICVLRLGLSNDTRRTLERVRRGKCTHPFTVSQHQVFGVNIGFDDSAHKVRDCLVG